MRHKYLPYLIAVLFLFGLVFGFAFPVQTQDLGQPLNLLFKIALPGVEGRIDHMTLDAKHSRLFVAALGNNTVEMIDLQTRADIRSLKGFKEPQGVLYVEQFDKLFVTEGEGGLVRIFYGDSLIPVDTIPLEKDADNIRYDSTNNKVLVGYGTGGLAIIDPATDKLLDKIPLGAHPESFQIDITANQAFVNLPYADEVAVIDILDASILARWHNNVARNNFPMAIDSKNHQLLIGYRDPPTLEAIDSRFGTSIFTVPIEADPDDIFIDPSSRLIYISSGAGIVQLIDPLSIAQDSTTYKTPTASGARTCLLDSVEKRLFVAVPHRGRQSAEIWVFELK